MSIEYLVCTQCLKKGFRIVEREGRCKYCKQVQVLDLPDNQQKPSKAFDIAAVKDYIRKNLSIQVREFGDYYSRGLRILITLEGEEIDSDSFNFPNSGYN